MSAIYRSQEYRASPNGKEEAMRSMMEMIFVLMIVVGLSMIDL